MGWAEEMGYDVYDSRFRHDADGIWITKDGKEIRIKNMEDSHLLNAYKRFDDERLLREMVVRLFESKVKGN